MEVPTGDGPNHARTPPSAKGVRRASELLMRRYYWAAKAVTQLNQILMLNIRERLNSEAMMIDRLRPINERFFDKGGTLEIARDDLYESQPHAILETFLLYQTTVGIKALSARTLRALYNARPIMNAAFRADPVNRATFLAILKQPEGITHAMRLMNETSVLGRYLWVFRHIVGQMQHDLFHVYTVDQHILMVVRNVRRFFIAEHSHEYPFCSQLAAGWDKPWILYVAALFHDIAKGRGGDHSELGAHDVRVFCRQHGIGTALLLATANIQSALETSFALGGLLGGGFAGQQGGQVAGLRPRWDLLDRKLGNSGSATTGHACCCSPAAKPDRTMTRSLGHSMNSMLAVSTTPSRTRSTRPLPSRPRMALRPIVRASSRRSMMRFTSAVKPERRPSVCCSSSRRTLAPPVRGSTLGET